MLYKPDFGRQIQAIILIEAKLDPGKAYVSQIIVCS